MKKSKLKKMVAVLSVVSILAVMSTLLMASATDEYYYFKISGTKYADTDPQVKSIPNGLYQVEALEPSTNRAKMVLVTSVHRQNNNESLGSCEVYEGTINTGTLHNAPAAQYYFMRAIRQYNFDPSVYTHGYWDPDHRYK